MLGDTIGRGESMILHRYLDKAGEFVWTRGKTDALREARAHAKMTPKNVTLEVEAVELLPLTTKTLVLALLNGDDVVVYNEEGEAKATSIASIKGKCREREPEKPPPQPKLILAPPPPAGKRTIYDDPDDRDEQEYCMVYKKSGGWRLVKLEALRPGMRVAVTGERAAATVPGDA